MVDSVEIKVNIDASRGDALAMLGQDPAEGSTRQIWFAEERAGVERGSLPLFARHVVVRLRSGGDTDDLTVKLRPCEHAHLIGRWAQNFDTRVLEYRIEEDWSGQRRVLAASAVSTRSRGSLLEMVGPFADPASAITIKQRQFLKLCAPPEVRVNHLVALGPIISTKWAAVEIGPCTVNVERWITGEIDIVELSMRAEQRKHESAAEFEIRGTAQQRSLEASARDLGLPFDAHGETKTQRVLASLARIPVPR
ncbi:hypothetical protein FHT40_006327 [Mycolicibacterium sp. BK556]|uniref:hypothetical protein n=1 Tax=unclassified Mycolicibacterium TaxID=2636767 RepID=UPI0016078CCA|nr:MULTISPECIES: hypothetical protein [unclassified Mycolicibacterium]MBB3606636.1 hypothetical protein [Mycolicibacterium sp. BK556]MBB3636117.1 hypothetical protein [Mycolicibacterium sp. BK607]MBB3753745.1 hypothetical protein [Mycolicibacterium sp. BK634]